MKKAILLFVVGCVSAAILPGHLIAQDTSNQNSLVSAENNSKPVHSAAIAYGSTASTAADASTVSVKAIKDFKTRFASAKDEKWYTLNTGFVSYFSQDGYTNRAFYDKKGHWQASLRYIGESKLPRDIRAMVKSIYYDFTITVIEIAEVPDHMAYMIHLEDATTIKILRVSDEGEMEVYKSLIKS
jgi:hypothetical protein